MLRKLLFWAHLVVGVVAGMVILVLCVTGAAIAFEKEAIGLGEAGLRRVQPTPGTKPLSVDEMLTRAKLDRPGKTPSSLALSCDPGQTVVLSYGRSESVYMNPYTGATVDQGAAGTRRLMRVLTDWHRWLGRDEQGRAVGKAITGAANVTFSVRERGASPQYGSLQLWLDPYTGAVLKREGYAEFNSGRKLRMWFRFLHTGEALGVIGKLVAALASLGGAVLVWTGFALAWRRFKSRREGSPSASGLPEALRENV